MSVKAQAWVWELDLPHTRKLVLLALADRADDEGRSCYPRLKEVARKCGMDERNVRRQLRELEHAGLVSVTQRQLEDGRFIANEYELSVGVGSAAPGGGGANAPTPAASGGCTAPCCLAAAPPPGGGSGPGVGAAAPPLKTSPETSPETLPEPGLNPPRVRAREAPEELDEPRGANGARAGPAATATDARLLWQATLQELDSGMNKANFETYFRDTRGVDLDGNVLRVSVKSPFVAETLQERFLGLIGKAVRDVAGRPLGVRLVVQAERPQAQPSQAQPRQAAGGTR